MRWNGHDFHEAGSCPGRSGGGPTTIHQHADASLLAAHISRKSSLENKDVIKPRLDVSGVSRAFLASHSRRLWRLTRVSRRLQASHKRIWRLTQISRRPTSLSGVSRASHWLLWRLTRVSKRLTNVSGVSLASPGVSREFHSRLTCASIASPGVSKASLACHSRLQASHMRFWRLTRVSHATH